MIQLRLLHRPHVTPGFLLAALAVGLVAFPGCNQQGGKADSAEPTKGEVLTPATDPRVKAHLDTFGRAEALITTWDNLRADGRTAEARGLEPQIREEVDRKFATFVQGASGALGPHAQYLSVSALGFSANPQATRVLVQRLLEKDAELQGNALIALSVRADPNTPIDALLNRTSPAMPVSVKRYAPLALAKVIEARRRAGMPENGGVTQQALARLGALDPQMRVRWAAAGALEALGDPRGFPGVVRLLHDVAPDSKHIIRDILASYGGRLQGRPLTSAEIQSLGIGPRAWSQWYTVWRRSRGIGPGQPIQANGAIAPGPAARQPTPRQPVTRQPVAPQPARVVQPAPRPYVPSGASRGGG